MEDMEGLGQEVRESWSWVGGTTAAQGDPVGSAVEAGGPFVFSRRFTACKVETIDRPPNPGDETWVAASREYRMTYVTHAEASFGDPTTAEFSEHRKRIEEGLVPLRVGVAVPAGGDEAMKSDDRRDGDKGVAREQPALSLTVRWASCPSSRPTEAAAPSPDATRDRDATVADQVKRRKGDYGAGAPAAQDSCWRGVGELHRSTRARALRCLFAQNHLVPS